MNAQIAKEFRPLALPVAAAAILASISLGSDAPSAIAGMTFFGCIAVLACISFGAEFQQRTLPLLFTQPVSRSRLWRDKMFAVGLPVVALGLLRWRLDLFAGGRMSPMQHILLAVFLVASVCSAGFWTGRTGSVAVGVIAGFLIQILVFSLLDWVINICYGPEPFDWSFDQIKLVCLAGLLYSAMLVWLGWPFWKEQRFRFNAAVAAATLLYLVYFFACSSLTSSRPRAPLHEILLVVMSLVAVVCSGCFWTLVARSTVGGMAFSIAGLFLTVSLVAGGIGLLAPEFAFESPSGLALIGGGALLYSAAFLWLGWRKFARMELSDSVPSESNWSSISLPWLRGRLGWLRCRPAGAVRNLIRKELCLQKPVLTIAALFAQCWLALVILRLLVPSWRESIDMMLHGLTGTYLVLSLLLAGAISLGEDKGLGLESWHLTLPVTARTQWLVKLGISAAVGLLLGICLPALCEWLLFGWSRMVRLPDFPPDALVTILLVAGLALAISFWAATFASSTLRALLGSILGLGVLYSVTMLIAWMQDPNGSSGLSGTSRAIFLLLVSIAALEQSYLFFRRPQVKAGVWLKHSLHLAAISIGAYIMCRSF